MVHHQEAPAEIVVSKELPETAVAVAESESAVAHHQEASVEERALSVRRCRILQS